MRYPDTRESGQRAYCDWFVTGHENDPNRLGPSLLHRASSHTSEEAHYNTHHSRSQELRVVRGYLGVKGNNFVVCQNKERNDFLHPVGDLRNSY